MIVAAGWPSNRIIAHLFFYGLVPARIWNRSLQQVIKPYSKFTVRLIDPLEGIWTLTTRI